MLKLSSDDLVAIAAELGLTLVGSTSPEELEPAGKSLAEWQTAGYMGEMAYLERPVELLAHPRRLLPEAKSIISVAVGYSSQQRIPLPPENGRVARYAWGADYHKVLRGRLKALVEETQKRFSTEIIARCFSDAVPLLERAVAQRSGLGFQGRNTLLIRPRLGSLFFLGEVIWNVDLFGEPTVSKFPVKPGQGCGCCQDCLRQCPTGALRLDGKLDARRCISYLTIEKRGLFSEWERRAIGEWLFGCDICQEVCRYNQRRLEEKAGPDWPEFDLKAGPGSHLSLEEILLIRDDHAFKRRFAGTALMRTGRVGLQRNAAAVAVNTESFRLISALAQAARSDSDEIIRESCLVALTDLLPMAEGLDRRRIKACQSKR